MNVEDLGLLLVRLVAAYFIAGHGLGKIGLLGGPGLERTAASFEMMGYRPGRRFAIVAATGEITSSILLVLGLLTPLAGAGVVALMGSASLAVPAASDTASLRKELARVLAIAPGGLLFLGAGEYSLDHLLDLPFPLHPGVAVGLLVAAVVAVVVGDRLLRRGS